MCFIKKSPSKIFSSPTKVGESLGCGVPIVYNEGIGDLDDDLDLCWGDYFQRSLYIIWNIGTNQMADMDQENFVYQFPINDPVYTSGQNMPSFADLDGDNDMDLYITVLGGDGPIQLNNNFLMYENIGSITNPTYDYRTSNFLNSLDLSSDVVPQFIDINSDGDLDFFSRR